MGNNNDGGAAVAMIGTILFIIGLLLYIYEEVTWLGTYYPYTGEGVLLMFIGGIMIIVGIVASVTSNTKSPPPPPIIHYPQYQAPPPEPTKMCLKCGAHISVNSSFCPHCGANIHK